MSMKRQILFAVIVSCLVVVTIAAPARATFHLWTLSELYSNTSGSTQFIELFTNAAGQEFFGPPSNAQLISTNLGGTITKTYTFPSHSPSPTNGHSLLIATPGFDSQAGVTPDYVLDTSNFLFTDGGNLKLNDFATGGFESAFSFNYGPLPTNGTDSLDPVNSVVNSPTNYNGVTGFVPEPATATLLLVALWALLFCRFGPR